MTKVESFEEFMSYVDWNELDINEKQGLYDVANEHMLDVGIFKLEYDETERGYILYDNMHDVKMHLTPDQKQYFPRWLEEHYMNGEDGNAYLAMEKNRYEPTQERSIHILPQQHIRIIKKIFIGKTVEHRFFSGVVLYGRLFNAETDYVMHPQERDGVEKALFGYDEEEYPHDFIDDLIIKSIKTLFPDAYTKSQIQLFDTDWRENKRLFESKKVGKIGLEICYHKQIPTLVDKQKVVEKQYSLTLLSNTQEGLAVLSHNNLVFAEDNTEKRTDIYTMFEKNQICCFNNLQK